MNTRRRGFRPEVEGALEARLILSTISPVHAATVERAIENGPQLHPEMIVTDAGSGQIKALSHGGRPLHDQLTFSAHELNVTASQAGGSATLKVDYHNESKTTITSATIEEDLGPNLTYDPLGVHTPPGGQVTVTTNSKGWQVVQLKLPDGIAAGSEGYLEFRGNYRAS